jgi:adenylosuccinate lyase
MPLVDSKLFGWKFRTDEMRAIWSDESVLDSWLRVEAALARAQAALDLIPTTAGEAIDEHADVVHVPIADVAEEFKKTNLSSVAMIRVLSDAVPDHASEYVHWGATTTDITETGLSLRIRNSIDLLEVGLAELTAELSALALEHADTVMVARTHSQHALPTTFGLAVARWARMVDDRRNRLLAAGETACVGKVTGAAGTYASFGDIGRELERGVCDRLDLVPADVSIQVSQARLRTYTRALGAIATTCGQIANEAWNRQRTELGELAEPFVAGEDVGSSSLAFKRNPFQCEWIRSNAAIVKYMANAMEDLTMEDERDGTRFAFYRGLIPVVTTMTHAIVRQLVEVISDLDVSTERMRENLEMSADLVVSERIQLELAKRGMGKQSAHEVIYDCGTLAADRDESLVDLLKQDERVLEYVDAEELESLALPESYLGESERLVEETIGDIRR